MWRRLSPLARVALVVAAAGALAIAWWLGSPLVVSREVSEAFPMTRTAEIPEGMSRAEAEQQMADAAQAERIASDAMPAGAPAAIARGTFVDADSFHKGEGTATIYRIGGRHVLRFEAFRVTNGPDLRVILTANPRPDSRAAVMADYVELGRLKGNIGSQNYEIPADVDPGRYRAVVIYCWPFHVIFSTATLAAP